MEKTNFYDIYLAINKPKKYYVRNSKRKNK